MGKIIAVVSPENGVGKTTTVAAISSCLAALGFKTLCIDFRSRTDSSENALGVDFNEAEYSFGMPGKKCNIIETCKEHPRLPNLYYMSVKTLQSPDELEVSDVISAYADIRGVFDYCLIDTLPGIGDGCRLSHADADIAMMVTTDDPTVINSANWTASAILGMVESEMYLVVNRLKLKNSKLQRPPVDSFIEEYNARLVGIIPEDKYMHRAQQDGIPLIQYKKKLAALDFLDAAYRITGEAVPWRFEFNPPFAVLYSEKVLPKGFVNKYGDPRLWAKSTLPRGSASDLVMLFEVNSGNSTGIESIRYRIWVHDLLDDNGIQYKIEERGIDAQCIFVEKKDEEHAKSLIDEFYSSGNIARELTDKTYISAGMVSGVSQIECPSCRRSIDFDHHKCPHCKASL